MIHELLLVMSLLSNGTIEQYTNDFASISNDSYECNILLNENKFNYFFSNNNNETMETSFLDLEDVDMIERNLYQSAIIENNQNIIRDKTITVGDSSYENTNIINVGKSRLLVLNEYNQIVNAEYKAIIGLDLPHFNPEAIISTSLIYKKKVSYPTNYSTNSLLLSKVTNLNYDNITGISNLSKSDYTFPTINSNYYTFLITNTVIDSLETDHNLTLCLEDNNISIGYNSFYSSDSSVNKPYLHIETDSSIIGSTLFGNAPDYEGNTDSGGYNCFEYALNNLGQLPMSYDITINDLIGHNINPNHIYKNEIISFICDKISSYGYNCRYLDNQYSFIYSNERRIAFKYTVNSSHFGYHFTKQTSDGKWACKNGFNGQRVQYPTVDGAFELYDSYDSDILYFAI